MDYVPLPRDLYFGWQSQPFEGDVVPVASPEKALLDWLHHAEQTGLDSRLDELEWDRIDLDVLDDLAKRTGIDWRAHLPPAAALSRSAHDQPRRRLDALRRAGVTWWRSGPGGRPDSAVDRE